MPLSTEQKRMITGLAASGCDREIAVLLAGGTWDDLIRELTADESFANELVHNEARAELVHVRNVQEAARDPKNWRCSTWWLDRRAPERYGRRAPRSICYADWQEFVHEMFRCVDGHVSDDKLRNELLDCLQAGATKLQNKRSEEDPHAA